MRQRPQYLAGRLGERHAVRCAVLRPVSRDRPCRQIVAQLGPAMPATSSRRCPVSISNRTIGPNGGAIADAARQIAASSSSVRIRSRFAFAPIAGRAANGFARQGSALDRPLVAGSPVCGSPARDRHLAGARHPVEGSHDRGTVEAFGGLVPMPGEACCSARTASLAYRPRRCDRCRSRHVPTSTPSVSRSRCGGASASALALRSAACRFRSPWRPSRPRRPASPSPAILRSTILAACVAFARAIVY